jgi:nitrogen-specific signal transduction histidine kinase
MKSYGCWPIISYLGFSCLLQDPILYIGLKRNTLQMHTGGKRTLFEFRAKQVKKKEGMVSLSVYNTNRERKMEEYEKCQIETISCIQSILAHFYFPSCCHCVSLTKGIKL